MKQKGIITGICVATILLTSFSVPIGNKNDLLQWDPLSLNVLAEGVQTPFQINGQARFATIEQNSASITITDSKDLNALVTEINALDAQPISLNQNPHTGEENWGFVLTLSMPDGEYTYTVKDFSVLSSGGKTDTIFDVHAGNDSPLNGQYTSTRYANVLKGIVDGLCAGVAGYPYMTPHEDKLFSTVLLNNQKRTSVYLARGSQNPQIAEELSKIQIEKKTEDLSLAGGKIYGVDEMRMDVYEGRVIFQFYDNGLVVSPLYGPDNGKKTLYLCENESLKPLYDLTAKIFAYSDTVNPSWLGLASQDNLKSILAIDTSGKSVFVTDGQVFLNLQWLSVFRSSKAEVTALPTTWDYRYDIAFKTGVAYTVILQGEYIYIAASDIEDEILRYKLMDGENLNMLKQNTQAKIQAK